MLDQDDLPAWNADPGVGKFLEFRVQTYSGQDLSMNPADYVPGGLPMIPLNIHSQPDGDLPAGLENVRHRTFEFGRGGTNEAPWVVVTDGNLFLPPRIPMPRSGTTRIPGGFRRPRS